MNHRGPFQPQPFCDSVNWGQCGVSAIGNQAVHVSIKAYLAFILENGYGPDHYSSSLKTQNSRDPCVHDILCADQECWVAVCAARAACGCKQSWLDVSHRLRLRGR